MPAIDARHGQQHVEAYRTLIDGILGTGVYLARLTPAGKLVEYEQLPGTAASRTAGKRPGRARTRPEPGRDHLITI